MGKIRTFVKATADAVLKFWEEFQTTFGGKKTSIWTPETTDTDANAAIKPKGNGCECGTRPRWNDNGRKCKGRIRNGLAKVKGANTPKWQAEIIITNKWEVTQQYCKRY